MTELELINKMNILGTMMKKYEVIRTAFEESTRNLTEEIESLKSELKTEFLNRKESKETDVLVVKYRNGAVRWDSDALRVYAKTHPELNEFRKTGEPTIAFSLPKAKEEA